MRKGEDIREEISFNGIDGLKSPELIRALRVKAFSLEKAEDPKYMATLASMCFTGPALEWFENLGDDVQTDWSLLRRALLARFPASDADHKGKALIFTGDNPKECEEFIRSIRQHSHSEGKSEDNSWMAHYAAGCMAGDALKWHAKLDAPVRNNWIHLERALLAYFSEPPPYGLTPAGKILVERWDRIPAPSFVPSDQATWLRQALERRAAYDKASPGELTSVYWVLVEEGGEIPSTAIHSNWGRGLRGSPFQC